MSAITSLFSLLFKLIKWTVIIGIIGFVATMAIGIVLQVQNGKINLPSGDEFGENVVGPIGVGMAIIGMVVAGLLTLKSVIGGLSGGGGGGGYSAPSGPKQRKYLVRMEAFKKTDFYFSKQPTSNGYAGYSIYHATNKGDAIQQATVEHAELLLTGRGKIKDCKLKGW